MVTSRPSPPVPPVTRTILSWKFMIPSIAIFRNRAAPVAPTFRWALLATTVLVRRGGRAQQEHLLPRLFEELGNQPRPSRLMARAQSRSGVPVKIFVKQNQIAPQGIVLKFFVRRHTPAAGHFHRAEKYASRIGKVPRSRPRATFACPNRTGTPRENHLRNNDEISEATRSSENSWETTRARASSSFRRTSRSAIPPVRSPRDIRCR